jgi:hypothetical protein
MQVQVFSGTGVSLVLPAPAILAITKIKASAWLQPVVTKGRIGARHTQAFKRDKN